MSIKTEFSSNIHFLPDYLSIPDLHALARTNRKISNVLIVKLLNQISSASNFREIDLNGAPVLLTHPVQIFQIKTKCNETFFHHMEFLQIPQFRGLTKNAQANQRSILEILHVIRMGTERMDHQLGVVLDGMVAKQIPEAVAFQSSLLPDICSSEKAANIRKWLKEKGPSIQFAVDDSFMKNMQDGWVPEVLHLDFSSEDLGWIAAEATNGERRGRTEFLTAFFSSQKHRAVKPEDMANATWRFIYHQRRPNAVPLDAHKNCLLHASNCYIMSDSSFDLYDPELLKTLFQFVCENIEKKNFPLIAMAMIESEQGHHLNAPTLLRNTPGGFEKILGFLSKLLSECWETNIDYIDFGKMNPVTLQQLFLHVCQNLEKPKHLATARRILSKAAAKLNAKTMALSAAQLGGLTAATAAVTTAAVTSRVAYDALSGQYLSALGKIASSAVMAVIGSSMIFHDAAMKERVALIGLLSKQLLAKGWDALYKRQN